MIWCFEWGGEEFAGILVSDTPNETSEWLAQLTHEVERLKIPHSPVVKEPFLTISIGIFSAQVNDLSCINTIYKTADKALYQAKFQGRNQAVIVKPLPRS
ncbi:MAG: diguanylate cyclase [Thiotrichales bacterium]|nr:diguanylate cyclase [Thiotrichales bacterium]